MELTVWVDGVPRVVCGVNEHTNVYEVVRALAQATKQTGHFFLLEKWRNVERALAAEEHPVQALSQWGEYAGQVQLVLRKKADVKEDAVGQRTPPPVHAGQSLKKNYTFSGAHGGAAAAPGLAAAAGARGAARRNGELRRSQEMAENKHNRSPSYEAAIRHRLAHAQPNGTNGVPHNRPPNVPPPPPPLQLPPGSPIKASTLIATEKAQPNPERSPAKYYENGTTAKNRLKDSEPSSFQRGGAYRSSMFREAPPSPAADLEDDEKRCEKVEKDEMYRVIRVQEDRLKEQRRQIETTETELTELESKEKLYNEEFEKLGVAIEDLEKKNQVLQEKIVEHEREQLEQALNTEDDHFNRLTIEKLEFESRIEKLRRDIAQNEREIEVMTNDMKDEQERLDQLKKEMERKELLQEQEMNELRSSLDREDTAQSERNENLSQLEKEMADLERELNEKRSELETLEEHIKEANLESFNLTPSLPSPTGTAASEQLTGSAHDAVATSRNPQGIWV